MACGIDYGWGGTPAPKVGRPRRDRARAKRARAARKVNR
jgi:hypothetical protein